MKTLSIGDLHGRDIWKSIVNNNIDKVDKIVFIGDYCDSFSHTDEHVLNNLKDIITLKLSHMDKVVLLLGNHDVPYLFYEPEYSCSGFRRFMFITLNTLFLSNQNLFQIVYQYKNVLWSHAGISNRWWKAVKDNLGIGKDYKLLNDCFFGSAKFRKDIMNVGRYKGGYGDGGPLWCDKEEIMGQPRFDPYIHQIVGHTKQNEIITYNRVMGKTYELPAFTFIDVMDSKKPEGYFLDVE
jgi:Calcineurin-like phosphoesterase